MACSNLRTVSISRYYFNIYIQGLARTHVPTNVSSVVTVITLGLLAGVSQTEMQLV